MSLSLRRSTILLGAWASIASLIVAGCQMSAHNADGTPTTGPATATLWPPAEEKGGAQLWAESCSRCHNLRSPSSYGPAQWEIAVFDMRVRANLTGEEQRKILAFLKAASQHPSDERERRPANLKHGASCVVQTRRPITAYAKSPARR